MKKNDRYNYVRVPRSDDEGNRTYDVRGMHLPSVTTILSRTKDQGFIKRWKAKVGEEQAEVIKNMASKRGTSMHKFIEAFILQKGYEDMTSLGQQARLTQNCPWFPCNRAKAAPWPFWPITPCITSVLPRSRPTPPDALLRDLRV